MKARGDRRCIGALGGESSVVPHRAGRRCDGDSDFCWPATRAPEARARVQARAHAAQQAQAAWSVGSEKKARAAERAPV